jgi:hypothetical protein
LVGVMIRRCRRATGCYRHTFPREGVSQTERPPDGNAPQVEGAQKGPPGVQRPVVAADRGEDVTVIVSKVRMLVPQPRLADAGVTVAMLVTTTAGGRRR